MFFNEEKVDLYKLDIISELEVLIAKCPSYSTQPEPANEHVLEPKDVFSVDGVVFEEATGTPGHQQSSFSGMPSISVPEVSEDEESRLRSEHEFECARECLLNDSFYRSEFQEDKFLSGRNNDKQTPHLF